MPVDINDPKALSSFMGWYSEESEVLFKSGYSGLEINSHRFKRALKYSGYSFGEKVADLGSYPGYALHYFHDYVGYGLPNPLYARKLEQLGRKYIDISFSDSLPPLEAELVLFQEVIEHINNPYRALRCIYDSMPPGSRLYMTTNNLFYSAYIIKLIIGAPIYDSIVSENSWYPGHCRYYGEIEMRRFLEEVGFRVLSSASINLVPPRRYFRSFPTGLLKSFLPFVSLGRYGSHIELLALKA